MVLGVVGILSDEVVDLIDDAFEFVDCWDIEDIDLNDFVISRFREAFSLSLQGRNNFRLILDEKACGASNYTLIVQSISEIVSPKL